jgi:hypothetical protein
MRIKIRIRNPGMDIVGIKSYIIKLDKILNFLLKSLCIFDKIVRMWIFLPNTDPRIRNQNYGSRSRSQHCRNLATMKFL